MPLDVSDTLYLPDEYVMGTAAMIAVTGSGKSNSVTVLAEQMWDAGHQFVILDPKGDFYGMRTSADGESPGIPIPIFGGLYGDVDLTPQAGKLIAQLVVDHNLTCILDVSDFDSKADQIRFSTDFARELWRLIRRKPRPLHLFIEEADEFLPQTVKGEDAPMVGAYAKISRQGRKFGLGVTLITQRSATLNKNSLSQTKSLIIFQTTSPHDMKAINEWARPYPQAKEIKESMPFLKPGECWILAPQLGIAQRFQWNRRWTFDSGAAPEMGVINASQPKTLADIDLGAIADMMHATTGDVPDPDGSQQAEIARLEAIIADQAATMAGMKLRTPTVVEVEVDVPVIPAAVVSYLHELRTDLTNIGTAVTAAVARCDATLDLTAAYPTTPESRIVNRESGVTPRTQPENMPDSIPPVTGLAKTILGEAAHFPTGIERPKLGVLMKKAARGGYFNNVMGRLRADGLVEPGWPLVITPLGVAAVHAAGDWEPLPTGPEALDYWVDEMGGLAGEILRILSKGEALDRATLSTRLGGKATQGGYFNNVMTKLRSVGFVAKGWPTRATDDFLDAIR